MKEHTVKVVVFYKDGVYGSISNGKKYEADGLIEFIEFLNAIIEKIPEAYRSTAKFEVDSVGGYEGEHHASVEVYYERPENDEERDARLRTQQAAGEREEREDRRMLERLKAKYGG